MPDNTVGHTPGPYTVEDVMRSVRICGHPHEVYPITSSHEGGTGVAICILPHEDISPENRLVVQKNAIFLASAPKIEDECNLLKQVNAELLAALENLVAWADMARRDPSADLAQARAAIAKAKGQTT